MPITTAQAQASIKSLNAETFSLNPSAIIDLYEIDITDIINNNQYDDFVQTSDKIFRFHSIVKLMPSSIWWRNNEYVAAPINVEGYEINSQGTLPTPKMSICVNDEGIPLLAALKTMLQRFGDLTGAKVSRIRTFASNLDKQNWTNGIPEGFTPDPNRYFPPDVFFIDRKSFENKQSIEFELASLLDIEGIKLPGRLVLANRCIWTYRGYGCFYEYTQRRNSTIHGDSSESSLPAEAPPIANEKDELIKDLLPAGFTQFKDRGEWTKNTTYSIGDYVYIQINNIKYYFVSKVYHSNVSPPNTNYWVSDSCSHTCAGCKLRYGTSGSVRGTPFLSKGNLPMGAFPGADKVR